ncbi:MAG: dimethylargininase [Gemmatimonadota bacterium]|nr:dimethylargininase [Gemmatimonadota bacterium]MDE3217561.1 dimethylargininase [Gemmatimonadota bacterium]
MTAPPRAGSGPPYVAITRPVSATIDRCELTHRERRPIDVERARQQHAEYEEALRTAGCAVERLEGSDQLPDAVFVEDTAVVLDEIAVVTRPGAAARRAELPAVELALLRHRPLACIRAPATLDGGDVLVAGRRVFVGRSSRTSDDGISQLADLLAPFGYAVEPVPVLGCLHLKSAVTALGNMCLLINRAWTRADAFRGFDLLDVHPFEPDAANILRVGEALIYPAEFPRTLERLERRGLNPRTVPAAELAKAEGAVTCCSLILTT